MDLWDKSSYNSYGRRALRKSTNWRSEFMPGWRYPPPRKISVVPERGPFFVLGQREDRGWVWKERNKTQASSVGWWLANARKLMPAESSGEGDALRSIGGSRKHSFGGFCKLADYARSHKAAHGK